MKISADYNYHISDYDYFAFGNYDNVCNYFSSRNYNYNRLGLPPCLVGIQYSSRVLFYYLGLANIARMCLSEKSRNKLYFSIEIPL